MKINKWSFICSFALLTIASAACSQSISKEQILKFKIASISKFNEKDELEEYAYYNADGNPIHLANSISPSIDLVYSGKKLLSEKAMSFDGPLQSTSTYTYNAQNQPSLITIKDNKGAIQKKTTFEYDSKGNTIEVKSWSPDNNLIIKYAYEGSLLIEKTQYENDSILDEKVNYKYDSKGKLTEEKKSYGNGASTISFYTYDSLGNLIQIKEELSQGAIITNYKYNFKGLLESENWKSTLESKSHSFRYVIEYY